MYGVTRMFYENLLSVDTLTNVDFDGGFFSGAIKNGLGSATMQVQGSFTGLEDLLYLVQITLLEGTDPAKYDIWNAGNGASYRWRSNKTSTEWASNDTYTRSTFFDVGADGLEIKFTAGAGHDFEFGDQFFVTASAAFSPKNLFDERRDTYMRKLIDNTLHSWAFHLPTVQAGDRLVFSIPDYGVTYTFYDYVTDRHPRTFSPLIFRIRGGSTSAMSEYSKSLAWNPGTPLVAYLDDLDPEIAYTYWSFDLELHKTDSDIQYAYFWIGQMFLGEYIEFPTAAMWNWGSQHDRQTTFSGNNQNVDVVRQISDQRRTITANWQNIKSTDFAILNTLYDSVLNRGDNIEHPIFFHEFSDEADRVYWMKAVDGALTREYTGFNRDNTTLKLMEVAPHYVL